MIATDIHGNVTFLNPVAQELCGWSAEEAIGAPLPRVFHIVDEQTREVMEDPVAKVLREERAVRLLGRTVLISKDLVERPIEDNGAPIRDEEGNLRGVVLVFRDVTQTPGRRGGSSPCTGATSADGRQRARLCYLHARSLGTYLELGHRLPNEFSAIRNPRSSAEAATSSGSRKIVPPACPRKNDSPREHRASRRRARCICARTAAGSSPAAWSRPSADLPESFTASRRSARDVTSQAERRGAQGGGSAQG